MEILESFSDNLDYDVTTDLKKYVAQRYKVRIVEEEENGGGGDLIQTAAAENKNIPLLTALVQNDQMTESGVNASANMNTIVPEEDGYGTFIPYRDRMVEPKKEKDVEVEVLDGNIIPVIQSIETNQSIVNMEDDDNVGQQSANECDINPVMLPPESVPQLEDIAQNNPVLTDVADHTDIPLITHSSSDNGNKQNDLHTDDVGQDTLCFDIVVDDVLLANNTKNSETPVTVRRSARSMKRGRNVIEDEDGEAEDKQKKKTKSPSLDDRPSTSTVRRSGRVVKRPAYSIDDEDGEDDNPVPRKVNSTPRKQAKIGKSDDSNAETGIECRKCMKQLGAEFRKYSRAKHHAITHTDLVRYECPVDGCSFKSGLCYNFDSHTRKKHGRRLPARNIDLTAEQKEELDQMVKECFPVFKARDKYRTCAICQVAIANDSIDQYQLKRHSLQHIDFMLYKCNQTECGYESKHYQAMKEHGRKKHKIEEISKKETEIELTDNQKKEIDDVIEKCFPTDDINNTVSAGMECKNCSKQFSCKYYCHAKEHAITHTDIKRYECPVDGCDYKSGHNHTVRDHAIAKHGNRALPSKKIDLTDEQEEELDRITKECFPVFETKNEYMVCTICQTAILNNGLSQRYQKFHSLQHIDFMLYKCNQQKCQYETKHYNYMSIHLRNEHGIDGMSKKDTAIELTDNQKKEIDDMLVRCFPDDDDVEE